MGRWRRARQKKAPPPYTILKARDPFCGALDADSRHFRSTAWETYSSAVRLKGL